jgi:hypothetical protein
MLYFKISIIVLLFTYLIQAINSMHGFTNILTTLFHILDLVADIRQLFHFSISYKIFSIRLQKHERAFADFRNASRFR